MASLCFPDERSVRHSGTAGWPTSAGTTRLIKSRAGMRCGSRRSASAPARADINRSHGRLTHESFAVFLTKRGLETSPEIPALYEHHIEKPHLNRRNGLPHPPGYNQQTGADGSGRLLVAHDGFITRSAGKRLADTFLGRTKKVNPTYLRFRCLDSTR